MNLMEAFAENIGIQFATMSVIVVIIVNIWIKWFRESNQSRNKEVEP